MVNVLENGVVPTYTTTCTECGAKLEFNKSDIHNGLVKYIYCKCCQCKTYVTV